jgi:hypothetical protein
MHVLSSADVAQELMLSETGQMAVCCQNSTLGALNSHSALSVLVGTRFKTLGLLFERASYL